MEGWCGPMLRIMGSVLVSIRVGGAINEGAPVETDLGCRTSQRYGIFYNLKSGRGTAVLLPIVSFCFIAFIIIGRLGPW